MTTPTNEVANEAYFNEDGILVTPGFEPFTDKVWREMVEEAKANGAKDLFLEDLSDTQ